MRAQDLIEWAVMGGVAWMIFSSMTGIGSGFRFWHRRKYIEQLEERVIALEKRVSELSSSVHQRTF